MIDTYEVEDERVEAAAEESAELAEDAAPVESERLQSPPRRGGEEVEYFVRTQRHRRRDRAHGGRRGRGR
jgi:hypothetical protein